MAPQQLFFRAGKFATCFTFILLGFSSQLLAGDKDSLEAYPWIRPEINYIQFYKSQALQSFYEKWKSVSDGTITIAHFGDSHVQSDIYSGELRRQLQEVKGYGGLGMMFPYSTARTYATVNYKSRHTGIWTYAKSIEYNPRLPLGASGATCRTLDSTASFTLEFKNTQPADYRRLKLYCRQQKSSYDMIIRSGDQEIQVTVDSAKVKPYLEVELPVLGNTITVQLVKNHDYESDFEFYGMSLESVNHSGLILHCLGIGGSQYGSLLKEELLNEQLPALTPDLIILDFGTNDFLYNNRLPAALEGQIVDVIQKAKKAAPQSTILLTTTQDMNRKRRNITAAEQFSQMIRRLAREQDCPFYDWYWISGGPQRMVQWHESGLSQRDLIHLTVRGYTLKGRMLAAAIKNSMSMLEADPKPDSLIFNLDSVKQTLKRVAGVPVRVEVPVTHVKTVLRDVKITPPAVPGNMVTHLIEHGETLSTIAKQYGVTVQSIKDVNGLESSRIVAGKYLLIDRSPKNMVMTASKPVLDNKYIQHKVERGETLSTLSRQYNVSVDQLQLLNGLSGTKIKAGEFLKIKLKDNSTPLK